MVKKQDKNKWAEVDGWYGMAAILSAYALVSFKMIPSDGIIYQLLNLTGAAGLLWISSVKRVRPLIVLNAVWALIAVVALLRILF
ncbi:hypothetical protein BH23PAT1_BH23PAT1_4580 [soil metagenome]